MLSREQIASAERFGNEFDTICRQAEAAIDLLAACRAAAEWQHAMNEETHGLLTSAIALAEKVSPC